MIREIAISGQPIVLYGRFPFAAAAVVTGPLLAIVAAGTYVLVTTNDSGATLGAQVATAIAGFILLIVVSTFAVVALRLRHPALVLSVDGLRSYSLALRWQDIANINIRRWLWQRYVALELRDPEAVLKALPTATARAYAAQLKRGFSIPPVRGLSAQQLYTLVSGYWKEAPTAENGTQPLSAATTPFGAAETALTLAGGVLGAVLLVRWMDVVGCLREGNPTCALENAALAIGVAVCVYLVASFALHRFLKARPEIDLLRALSIPQDVLGGVDPVLYDALGSQQVRREPYVVRLQKAPWRAVLYLALAGGCGMLFACGLTFCSTYFLQRGTSGSPIGAVFTDNPAIWAILLTFLFADLLMIPVALLALKRAAAAQAPSKSP